MKTIALIGTSHAYQRLSLLCGPDKRCRLEDIRSFECYLLKVCRQYGIKTVAEEMNEQSLEKAKKSWEKFKKDLEGKNNCNRLRAEIWARKEEELKRCLDALKWHDEGKSTPRRVAVHLSLRHRYCDPNSNERNEHKIDCEDHQKRERYWLKQLLRAPKPGEREIEWPVLFICGADHVESFSTLLKEGGYRIERINDDWES